MIPVVIVDGECPGEDGDPAWAAISSVIKISSNQEGI
jgi:hypothetical protein